MSYGARHFHGSPEAGCELEVTRTTPTGRYVGHILLATSVGNYCRQRGHEGVYGGPEVVAESIGRFYGTHPNSHIQGSSRMGKAPELAALAEAAIARAELAAYGSEVDGMAALSGMAPAEAQAVPVAVQE